MGMGVAKPRSQDTRATKEQSLEVMIRGAAAQRFRSTTIAILLHRFLTSLRC
jgi:hypothetical protein